MDYKERIEAAKEQLKAADAVEYKLPDSAHAIRTAVYAIYPELRESEDEKIKHEIKVILANTDLSQFALDYTFADMITWLEKQGEQKSAELAKGEDYGIDGLWHAQRILEKTFGKVDGYETDDGILSHECAISAVKELYEKKPTEWKQENREELSDFENAMMHIGGSFFGENAGLDPNDTAAIKEQAKLLLELAPKTEWSEKDEKILKDILVDVKFEGYNNDMQANSYKKINWLKSLKERYTWKPSNEQLYFLHWLANNVLTDGEVDKKASEILNTLYDDLKKL